MGVGEYVQMRARQIAELGYVAFVADIYGKGVRPANTQEASAQAGLYRGDRPLLRARAQGSIRSACCEQETSTHRALPPSGTASAVARFWNSRGAALPLAGVISFHGNLDTPIRTMRSRSRGRSWCCTAPMIRIVPAQGRGGISGRDARRKGGLGIRLPTVERCTRSPRREPAMIRPRVLRTTKRRTSARLKG